MPARTDADHDDQPDEGGGALFDELVWRNPEVCNECFRRAKAVVEPPERAPDVAAAEHVREGYGGELEPVGEDHDEYGAIRTHHPRTVCGECGSVGLVVQTDKLSRPAAHERVDRLADRLDEAGVAVATEAMHRFVATAKSREDLQGYDREIFAMAVDVGHQWAAADPERSDDADGAGDAGPDAEPEPGPEDGSGTG